MARADRLALAFETGALALPEHGDVLVLRAVPSDFLDLVPPERLTCVQTFRPLHDALAAAGRRVATRAEAPAAMVVVNLTRSRAESLGNVAQGLGLLAPGGRLVLTRREGRRRRGGGEGARRGAAGRGLVRQGARAGDLARPAGAAAGGGRGMGAGGGAGGERRGVRDGAGDVLARACRSRQPLAGRGARRAARRAGGRSRRRLGLAGADGARAQPGDRGARPARGGAHSARRGADERARREGALPLERRGAARQGARGPATR